MKARIFPFILTAKLAGLFLVIWSLLVPRQASAGGTWQPQSDQAGDPVGLMILLSDGTVLAMDDPPGGIGNKCYRLTPDHYGHYTDGKWSARESMGYSRLWYSSQVLTDGRLLVAGGEYGTGWARSEIYDAAGHWTGIPIADGLLNLTNVVAPSGQNTGGFADSGSKMLPDGRVLVLPVYWQTPGSATMIFTPGPDIWSAGDTFAQEDEGCLVKLADDSILSIDIGANTSVRYIPSLKKWVSDQSVPVQIYSSIGNEMGASFLLPNGSVFFLGGAGHTAVYTPSPLGGTNYGTWVAGPDIPGGLVAADAPAAMMPNGRILCAVGPPLTLSGGQAQWSPPTSFYEFDYADQTASPYGSFTPVPAPYLTGFGPTYPTYRCTMLVLPDGNVLFNNDSGELYIYVPDGSPVASGKPTISSVIPNADGSFHLTGTGLNGISAGAAYGDDAQMDSNYPLVKFTNLSDGTSHLDYGRTYNWSSTGVMTGNTSKTTEFTVSPGLIPDTYALSVIANGISSDPVIFLAPVWVDFNFNGATQDGSFVNPFHTLAQGTNAVPAGGNIFIKNAGSSLATMTISKPVTIRTVGGAATIGR